MIKHWNLPAVCCLLLCLVFASRALSQSASQTLGEGPGTFSMDEIRCLPIFDMNRKVVCASNKVLQLRPTAKYVLNERFGVGSSFNELTNQCRSAHGSDSHRIHHRFLCLNQADGWLALISYSVILPPDPSLPLVVIVTNVFYETCVSADANKELARVIAKFGRKDLASDVDGLQYQFKNLFDAMNVYHRSGPTRGIVLPRDIPALKCAGDQRLEFQIRSGGLDSLARDYFQLLLARRATKVESKF